METGRLQTEEARKQIYFLMTARQSRLMHTQIHELSQPKERERQELIDVEHTQTHSYMRVCHKLMENGTAENGMESFIER